MTKKIISIVAIIAVLTVGYFVFKNGDFSQMEPLRPQVEDFTKPSEEEIANLPLPGSTTTDDDVELAGEITIEAKRSSDSTGFGAVQLVDSAGKEYYCNLIDVEKCNYGYNVAVAMKLVAVPAQGSAFGGWLNGCNNITTTNFKNDTCGITVYKFKRTVEIRFTLI